MGVIFVKVLHFFACICERCLQFFGKQTTNKKILKIYWVLMLQNLLFIVSTLPCSHHHFYRPRKPSPAGHRSTHTITGHLNLWIRAPRQTGLWWASPPLPPDLAIWRSPSFAIFFRQGETFEGRQMRTVLDGAELARTIELPISPWDVDAPAKDFVLPSSQLRIKLQP